MRVLITGINGYIGSNISENLWKKGFDIIGLDVCHSNLVRFCHDVRFQFFQSDITDAQSFPKNLKSAEILIHCAALVHRRSSDLSKDNFFKINFEGTKNILAFLDAKCLRHIIFLSTVSVYGASGAERPDEDTLLEPEDFYGESKVAAEREIREFSTNHSIPYTIFRLAPVYGKSFLLNLSKRVYLPKKIAFYRIASGRQRISLCSIYNVIDTVNNCLNDPKYFNEILILKDPEDYSALEIIGIWKEIFSEPRKPVVLIPRVIPEIAFEILGLVMPARAKSYKCQFKKIAQDAVYSGAKMASLGIQLKWNLRNALRMP
jgi:nucleoside-diphosphate-sugar epimerase